MRPLLAALSVVVAVAVATPSVCPSGYTFVGDTYGDEGHDSCIKVVTSSQIYLAAALACPADHTGSHLVSIKSTRAKATNALFIGVLQAAVSTCDRGEEGGLVGGQGKEDRAGQAPFGGGCWRSSLLVPVSLSLASALALGDWQSPVLKSM